MTNGFGKILIPESRAVVMLWGNKSEGILQLYVLFQEGWIYLHLWEDQYGRGCGEFSERCPETHRYDGHGDGGENSGGDET